MSIIGNKSSSFISKVRVVWSTLFSKKESPKDFQERSDLYKIAIALTFRDYRRKAIQGSSLSSSSSDQGDNSRGRSSHDDNHGSILSLHPKHESTASLEQMYDQAHEHLERQQIYDTTIRGLRLKVQELVRPQILSLLNVCRNIETIIPSTTKLEQSSINNADDDKKDFGYDEEHKIILMKEANKKKCCDILYEEQCQTLDLYENSNTNNNYNNHDKDHYDDNIHHVRKLKEKKHLIFLTKKLSAIQTIASFYKWEHFYFDRSFDRNNTSDRDMDTSDEFGYIQSTDEHVNNKIRYYQMINLSKSALIKQKLGFSIISLKSSLPKDTLPGRGIFVDGFAPAGTLLAFFPGDVWPKEYLINSKSPLLMTYFQSDPKYHLSLRYDDILIDARNSPYTVLDDKNSNAFALAHIVNHPPKSESPNCSTMSIDFIDDMKLDELELESFVPNQYKKKPMVLGPQAVDHDSIMMHSMGLLSSRDVENEELFYDYGFSASSQQPFPDWYHVCDEEATKNRWHKS